MLMAIKIKAGTVFGPSTPPKTLRDQQEAGNLPVIRD